MQRAMDLAAVRGASSWLTTLPLNEHGFALHKSAFQDVLALRYGWPPLRSLSFCACHVTFSDLSLRGAYPLYDIMRSETLLLLCLRKFAPKCVLNLNYNLLITLRISPLPLPTLREGAHLDIAANRF